MLTLMAGLGMAAAAGAAAADWPRFRGPEGRGVGDVTSLPSEIGPDRHVVWKLTTGEGHSSPVVTGNLIFLTGLEGGARSDAGRDKVSDEGKLFTYCVDRRRGELLWKREAPRPRAERYQPTNSPASPSAITDGRNVYVFFGDYGLLSYTLDGRERWRLPLGPFNNVNGHGTSPVLAGGQVILLVDQDTDSYLLSVDRDTGNVRWRTPRPHVTRSYTTPGIYHPAKGPAEIIVPGSYFLDAYSAGTGERLWWIGGLSWQPKSAPVIEDGVIYAHWWEAGGESEQKADGPGWDQIVSKHDANKDGLVSADEYAGVDPRMRRGFENMDLAGDGFLDQRDWDNTLQRRSSRNSLLAVRPGGRGDRTETTDVLWRLRKFLPNVPTPLIYQGVMYLIKDGGILTALNPKTGEILKQGRLTGALDTYYSSPVAGAGKVYLLSQHGQATVLKAGAQWEILSSSDFGEQCFATPAILDNALYLRAGKTLYKFAE